MTHVILQIQYDKCNVKMQWDEYNGTNGTGQMQCDKCNLANALMGQRQCDKCNVSNVLLQIQQMQGECAQPFLCAIRRMFHYKGTMH